MYAAMSLITKRLLRLFVRILLRSKLRFLHNLLLVRALLRLKGSKTANAAGLTGTGLTLNFTDSNVWKQLKADLMRLIRLTVYELDLNVQDSNQQGQDVTVKAL